MCLNALWLQNCQVGLELVCAAGGSTGARVRNIPCPAAGVESVGSTWRRAGASVGRKREVVEAAAEGEPFCVVGWLHWLVIRKLRIIRGG